ncbi:MAG: S8 family serine peptidase [Caldilineaceae bacterium]|nr:S8 family serine peptidase [Caldilineaceae bacterium]
MRTKYGKLEPALYDRLETVNDEELVPIAIWAAHTASERTPEAIAAEVSKAYPEAAKSLAEQGVAWAVADPDLRSEIEQAYNKLLVAETTKRVQPIIEWLKDRKYEIEEFPGMPSVAATVTKRDILELTKLESVSQLYLTGFVGQPTSDIAVPTIRVPTVWNRSITGTNVKLAIVEADKINSTADDCLDIIERRDATLPDSIHKSRVASIAACNDLLLRGVAYNADILDAGFTGTDVSAAQAVLWAVNNKSADVVNQSYRFQVDTVPAYLDKVYDYLVRTYFFAATIAAGNDPSRNVVTPAKGWNVIAVGNVDDNNNASWSDDVMRDSSGFNNPSTGVEKPEVAAPGTNINTVAGQDTGTSFAAPQVAGLAALLMQRKSILKDWPSAVKAIIMASAVHNIEGASRLSDEDGAGAIDAALADYIAQTQGSATAPAQECNAPCWWNISTNTSTPAVGGNLERFFNVMRGEHVRVAIAWLSQADIDGVNDSLRTNYDLYVRQPNNGIVDYSVSSNNGYEIVEFTAPVTGKYKIQVYRNPTGDAAESSNYLGIAWVKQATYLPDVRRNNNGWTSNIYIRNDSAEPRTVKITYLNFNGIYSESSNLLQPNALWLGALPPDPWQGSAIVDGSDGLSVFVETNNNASYNNYSGIASMGNVGWGQASGTLYIPLVKQNDAGKTSRIQIVNVNHPVTNVTVDFYQIGSTNICTASSTMATGQWSLTPGTGGCGAGRYSAKISTSPGQPLAVIVVEEQHNNSAVGYKQQNIISYRDLSSNGFGGLMPQVKNAPGNTPPAFTAQAIQNLHPAISTGVTSYYYQSNGIQLGAPCPDTANISANKSEVFTTAGCLASYSGFVGAARLTANQPVGTLVNENGDNGYTGFLNSSRTVIIPHVQRGNGWWTGIRIMNADGGAATNGNIIFYNSDGTQNGGSLGFTINGGYGTVNVGDNVPNGLNGSAIIMADRAIVVAVIQTLNNSSTATMMTNAVNR